MKNVYDVDEELLRVYEAWSGESLDEQISTDDGTYYVKQIY